jgi:hypothetical protein
LIVAKLPKVGADRTAVAEAAEVEAEDAIAFLLELAGQLAPTVLFAAAALGAPEIVQEQNDGILISFAGCGHAAIEGAAQLDFVEGVEVNPFRFDFIRRG